MIAAPVVSSVNVGLREGNPFPSGLLCDLLEHPERTLILTPTPTFGWVVEPMESENCQRAYQIWVASQPNLLTEGGSDMWDSGQVLSDQSINISYKGTTLREGCSYFWMVRLWFGDAPGSWSNSQKFTMGPVLSLDGISVYSIEKKEIRPKQVSKIASGTYFFDFGKAAFGYPEIVVEEPQDGESIVVRLGEKLIDHRIDRNPPGSIRVAEIEIKLDSSSRVYRVEPPPGPLNMREMAIHLPQEIGQVMPFRYLEIERLQSSKSVTAKMIRVQYPFDETAASFRSSDQCLNAVWDLCHHSILATTFAGYYVDGDRERIPYEADVYINQLSHYAVDREFSLARRSHEYLLEHPTWPTEWQQHSILIAWADYEATGDSRSLKRCYPVLQERLFLDYARADSLLDTGELRDIIDWPIGERDEYDLRPVNAVVNAFHYRTLVLMGRIAAILGRSIDASTYEVRARTVKDSFNQVFFDPQKGSYLDGEGSSHFSLHANLFALAFGLVRPTDKKSTIDFIKSRGMACSVYAAQFLLEALFEEGEAEYAIGLMISKGLRSWHNMLEQGATITWEAWDQSLKPNQDWNHAWGSAPANIIARYVLGVKPRAPGYGKISVTPQLGSLTFIEGTVPTIRGPIKVRAWRDPKSSEIRQEVQVPGNVHLI